MDMMTEDNQKEQTVNPGQEPILTQSGKPVPSEKNGLALKIICLVSFLLMITVNALASILPINGLDTGAVSDLYPNLFAPAGITFAIWGLIYLLLAIFTVYQFVQPASKKAADRMKRVQVLFIISSLANSFWIFAWHYQQIAISLVLMLIILLCLIICDRQLAVSQLSFREKLLMRLPFSVYFGWISVATVANVTALLVDIKWNRAGLSESFWTVIILVVAALIALAVITSRRNWAYGLVFVWAYIGILIKHLDAEAGFSGEYTWIIVTASICLGLLFAASGLALWGRSIRLTEKASTENP